MSPPYILPFPPSCLSPHCIPHVVAARHGPVPVCNSPEGQRTSLKAILLEVEGRQGGESERTKRVGDRHKVQRSLVSPSQGRFGVFIVNMQVWTLVRIL
jgi:hypothetical protein